jgi:hypothetical protein
MNISYSVFDSLSNCGKKHLVNKRHLYFKEKLQIARLAGFTEYHITVQGHFRALVFDPLRFSPNACWSR